jgi:signal recognition particle subunit SRP54
MVLQELGAKLSSALRKIQSNTILDEDVVNDMIKDIVRALLEADVNVRIVNQLRQNIKSKFEDEELTGINKRRLLQKIVIEELSNMLDSHTPAYKLQKGKGNVIMFVGLQGAGKTTTVAKFAHYYSRKGWRTCIVCADTFRAGAFDQVRQNATKLRLPFYGSYTEADPVRIAEEGVQQFRQEGYELIIVDTSGRNTQEQALFDEMKEIKAAISPDEIVFVMDATQGQAVYDQALGFREAVNVGSVIITKLDGHAKGGGALSAVAATKSPIIFLGTGERFDDLEVFKPQSFMSRLLGMGDISGLFEEIKDVVDIDKQPQMLERLARGEFTLRDMYEQFQNVMKLGPMNKVMSMIPGISQSLIPAGHEEEGNRRLKRFLYMMDSMTDDELDGRIDVAKSESRIMRIARGSGCHPEEVRALLKCHKQFSEVIGKMHKSNLLKGGDSNLMKQIQRNPNAVMQQLSKTMDPRMLQQMGGTQNMVNMMKQMSKMNKGDMQNMFGGFPGMS